LIGGTLNQLLHFFLGLSPVPSINLLKHFLAELLRSRSLLVSNPQIVESEIGKREGEEDDHQGDVIVEVEAKLTRDESHFQDDEHSKYYPHGQSLNLISIHS
jgi:hypothetical protein